MITALAILSVIVGIVFLAVCVAAEAMLLRIVNHRLLFGEKQFCREGWVSSQQRAIMRGVLVSALLIFGGRVALWVF
jgi:hypothetical protein